MHYLASYFRISSKYHRVQIGILLLIYDPPLPSVLQTSEQTVKHGGNLCQLPALILSEDSFEFRQLGRSVTRPSNEANLFGS